MSGLDHILGLLPNLTAAERSDLMAALKPLMQFSDGQMTLPLTCRAASPADSDCDMVLDAINRMMLRTSGETFPVARLRRAPGFKAFEEKVPVVMRFIRSGAKQRTQQIALLDVGVTLLHANMQQMGVAVSVRTVVNHTHRIPSVINAAFPGYAGSGKLGMIVRQYVKNTGVEGKGR